jgi:hypothetical protein
MKAASRNPFAPGAGVRPPELAGREARADPGLRSSWVLHGFCLCYCPCGAIEICGESGDLIRVVIDLG